MKIIRKNILSIIVAIIIAFVSFMSPGDINKINILKLHNVDKLVHTIMYFALAFTLCYENRNQLLKAKNYIYISIIPIIFGLIIEILQPIVTRGRTTQPTDELFNLAGTIVAVIFWYIIKHRKNASKYNFL
ncbi:MAG: VanZ family protein [Bacteroidales bacterium]|nr:VanZ family protein [Bacteroidales bacterium]